jgi:DNA gyrase subunit A
MAESILPVSISSETERRYLIYALSVIQSRALPDVRDGLKPVQRRILYTMYHDLHLGAGGRAAKCARIVGEVMGKYHPHGDLALYEALARMAQTWVVRAPLVDGQGNFGSVDGDPPAAYRYTEAKLTPLAETLLDELKQTRLTTEEIATGRLTPIQLRPTYNNEGVEPVVLPAQFPNLLVNGASGIAVGLATNIPPHNLGNAIDAAIHLIENPDATVANLLDKLKGPDFPLGGKVVTDRTTLRKIYEEGIGSIKIHAEWKLEEAGRRKQIVVTSIPPGVNKASLEQAIGDLITSRKLPQLVGLANESNEKEGLRIVLELKPDADPDLVMAYLYKHTALADNFAVNLTCLVPTPDGSTRPERLSLKDILRHFVEFRFATVRRRFEYDLEQLRKRLHVLQGFRIIFDALDRAIRLIRESQGKADASEKLIKAFKLDTVQTEAILDAQLYRIAQMEIKKILDELKEKTAEAARIEGILRSDKKLWTVVKEELAALGEKFGDRRRTRMALGEEPVAFDEEAFLVRENTNVVLTREGWIKRVGRLASVEGTRVREGDEVLAVVPGSTLDHVVFFADDGTAYTTRIIDVPASSGYGEPISKFFRLGDQVRVVAAVSTDDRFTPASGAAANGEPPPPHVLIVTRHGQVVRTPLAPFRSASTKVGRKYVKLADGDRVVFVQVVRDEHRSLFLASAKGHVLHFPVEEVNVLAGVGKGVIGIKLADDDECLGGALVRNQNDALVVETSGGKRMEFYGSRELTGRGGKGFEAVKRTTFTRVVPPPIELVDWDAVEDRAEASGQRRNAEPKSNQPSLFD